MIPSLPAAAVIILALRLAGQIQPPPLPSFDAASVKVDDSGSSSSHWDDHPGRMTVKNTTLRALIERAYDLQVNQIVGPGWLASAHYDIEAEMPAATSRAERVRMIQSLLAERFRLSFHREQKVLPVYLLVVTKEGAKMQLATPDGRGRSGISGSRGHMVAENASTREIAESLSVRVGRPVIDQTGLKGGFNFDLQFTPDDEEVKAASEDAAPSIFTALKGQLGLELIRSKAPVELFVIDHSDKTPTQN